MPLALLAALAGSLAVHAAALFLPDVDLSTAPEAAPVTVEIQPPSPPSAAVPAEPRVVKVPRERARTKPDRPAAEPSPPAAVAQAPESEDGPATIPAEPPQAQPEIRPEAPPEPPPAQPAEPQLPHRGFVRFVVYKGLQGFEVGRAEHRWEFSEGSYSLVAITETVGLAAFFKPIRLELESRGRLTAHGLQPERLTTRRNGSETSEKADFDWESRRVTLARDGRQYELRDGAQDVVSFHYQLAFLGGLAEGVDMGVATGRKFERYRFNSLGEESLDTPAGPFRTLHLKVQTDSTTEVWLALDHRLLPVKIRHTDKKGDSFEQVASEIGMP